MREEYHLLVVWPWLFRPISPPLDVQLSSFPEKTCGPDRRRTRSRRPRSLVCYDRENDDLALCSSISRVRVYSVAVCRSKSSRSWSDECHSRHAPGLRASAFVIGPCDISYVSLLAHDYFPFGLWYTLSVPERTARDNIGLDSS